MSSITTINNSSIDEDLSRVTVQQKSLPNAKMLARMSYFSSLATSALFFAFLSMPSPAQAAPSLNPRLPTPNPLDWLDLNASGVYQSPEDVPPDEECGVALSGGSLFFPNARINQQDGKIACDHVRLKFSGMTTGFAFQVIAVHLDGRATLGQSAFLDTAEVGVGYFPVRQSLLCPLGFPTFVALFLVIRALGRVRFLSRR